MAAPTYVAYVELVTAPIMPTPSTYVNILWQTGAHAEDVACGGRVRAGVLLSCCGWSCRRPGGVGNCVAPQGIGRPGTGKVGVAAVQFGHRRGVQLRSCGGGRTERVNGEPPLDPVAPRGDGRIRTARNERLSPPAPGIPCRAVHRPGPELLPLAGIRRCPGVEPHDQSQPVRAAATGSAGAGASSPLFTPSSIRCTAATISGPAAASPAL